MKTYTSPLPLLRGYTFSDTNICWSQFGGRLMTRENGKGLFVIINDKKWYFDDILQSAKDAGFYEG